MLQAGLVPGSYVGMGNHGTGCFTTAPGVSLGMHSLLQLSLCPVSRSCMRKSCFVVIVTLLINFRPKWLEAFTVSIEQLK